MVATTLRHLVLQSVCAISRWCIVQFLLRRVWIFTFIHSGEFLQIHPFTWSPFLPLFQWWRGVAEWWDIGVLRVWEDIFLAAPRLPSHVLQRLLGLFRVHVVLPHPWAEVQVRRPLWAALLVARKEAKPVGTIRRQRVSVSPPHNNMWPVALRVLHFTVQEYQ